MTGLLPAEKPPAQKDIRRSNIVSLLGVLVMACSLSIPLVFQASTLLFHRVEAKILRVEAAFPGPHKQGSAANFVYAYEYLGKKYEGDRYSFIRPGILVTTQGEFEAIRSQYENKKIDIAICGEWPSVSCVQRGFEAGDLSWIAFAGMGWLLFILACIYVRAMKYTNARASRSP